MSTEAREKEMAKAPRNSVTLSCSSSLPCAVDIDRQAYVGELFLVDFGYTIIFLVTEREREIRVPSVSSLPVVSLFLSSRCNYEQEARKEADSESQRKKGDGRWWESLACWILSSNKDRESTVYYPSVFPSSYSLFLLLLLVSKSFSFSLALLRCHRRRLWKTILWNNALSLSSLHLTSARRSLFKLCCD